jgi:hypothetical protein
MGRRGCEAYLKHMGESAAAATVWASFVKNMELF